MPDNCVILDTLGKLYADGHRLNGYCRACRRYFGVPMPVLIAARGAGSPVVGMKPLTCDQRAGMQTSVTLSAPLAVRAAPRMLLAAFWQPSTVSKRMLST